MAARSCRFHPKALRVSWASYHTLFDGDVQELAMQLRQYGVAMEFLFRRSIQGIDAKHAEKGRERNFNLSDLQIIWRAASIDETFWCVETTIVSIK
jgi:hypothetical protein